MERIELAPREGWKEKAEAAGFPFHTMYGEPYWVDDAAYRFSLGEIEKDIEDPSQELHDMCLEFVGEAVGSQEIMESLAIPDDMRDYVASTWIGGERSFYGRFDLAYRGEGTGPAKLLEYNADTPTSLFETGAFQWMWLEDQKAAGVLPPEADQFNSVHEAIFGYFEGLKGGPILHLAGATESTEDNGLLEYLANIASQVGLPTRILDITEIGVDAQGRFTDSTENVVIDQVFKLHPWEDMLRDDRVFRIWRRVDGAEPGSEAEYEEIDNPDLPAVPYRFHLAGSGTRFIEPAWKSILSNKGLLPWLWKLNRGHPNLLPAYFETDPEAASIVRRVRKPLFSREGQNVTIDGVDTGGVYGEEGFVVQEFTPLFHTDKGGTAVIGSWIVGDRSVGIGMREDFSLVTQNLSRFVPNVIL